MMAPLVIWLLDSSREMLEESVAEILEEIAVDLPKK